MRAIFITNYITPNMASFFKGTDWTVVTSGLPEGQRRSWLQDEVKLATHVGLSGLSRRRAIAELHRRIRVADAVVIGGSIRSVVTWLSFALARLAGKPTSLWLERSEGRSVGLTLAVRVVIYAGGSILAIGDKATAQYRSMLPGVSAKRVSNFPYSYGRLPEMPEALIHGDYFVTFGTEWYRKGLDRIFSTVSMLASKESQCESQPRVIVVGHVECAPEPPPGVEYVGGLAHGACQELIAGARAVLLCSRFDGWGVAIEEAMRLAIPVVVTNEVGASDLVRSGGGIVISSESFADGLVSAARRLSDPEAHAALAIEAFGVASRHAERFNAETLLAVVAGR